MAFNRQKTLTAVKIGLEVLYVLAIIGCIVLIVFSGMALKEGNEIYTNKEHAKPALIIAVLGLLISIIGLVGIIKENILTVAVLLVSVIIIGIIANLVIGEFWSAYWAIVCAVLTAVYLYLIIIKANEIGQTTRA